MVLNLLKLAIARTLLVVVDVVQGQKIKTKLTLLLRKNRKIIVLLKRNSLVAQRKGLKKYNLVAQRRSLKRKIRVAKRSCLYKSKIINA